MKMNISSYIKLLCAPKTDRIRLINMLMQEFTYEDISHLYERMPALHKGLFSLPYLRRKSYAQLYSTGGMIEKEVVEYIGILAFVFERNKTYISQFLKLKTEVEAAVLTGDYAKARQLIHSINSSISYSAWASELEIKIIRLSEGMSASSAF